MNEAIQAGREQLVRATRANPASSLQQRRADAHNKARQAVEERWELIYLFRPTRIAQACRSLTGNRPIQDVRVYIGNRTNRLQVILA